MYNKFLLAMFAARSMIRVIPQTRQMSAVVSGPPANHISLVEKLIHGSIMGLACLSLPAYVLANMRKYRGAA